MARPRYWTIEQLEKAIRDNVTWKNTAIALNIRTGSICLRRAADENNIDYSHFLGPGGATPLGSRRSDEEMFILNSPASNSAIRKRFKQLVDFKCSECGIFEWNERPAPLQMDHINGNKLDNRIENLRLLCANCHAQTDTWGRR